MPQSTQVSKTTQLPATDVGAVADGQERMLPSFRTSPRSPSRVSSDRVGFTSPCHHSTRYTRLPMPTRVSRKGLSIGRAVEDTTELAAGS
eukprot:scaffold58059_cov66-Phaeocystis_antarctica.AAC.2